MITTTKQEQQVENNGMQTVSGCPDSIFRFQKAKANVVLKTDEKSKQAYSL